MPWFPVDIPQRDTTIPRALEVLNAEPTLKKYFHNEIVERLWRRQIELETVSQEKLTGVQEAIKELKGLLEFLHKNTPPQERKNVYEQRSNPSQAG